MIETKGIAYFSNNSSIDPSEGYTLEETIFGPVFVVEKNVNENPVDTIETDLNLSNTTFKPISATHQLLQKLKETADQNILRKKAGYRFPADLKNLAVYLRINGGKLLYETLHRNLELALPSLDTTNRVIQKMNDPVIEGCLRTNELLKYLVDRDLELVVALSEDATSIEGRIQYDNRTNQIYGFVLPLDDKNGMPIPYSYPARSGEEIVYHFNNNNSIAKYVNVIMARPLANFPPFPLLIFGTDNIFKTHHVIKRRNFIENELKKVNIKVLTFSSDSDSRFNSAMRIHSLIGQQSKIFDAEWFCSGLEESFDGPFDFQDHPHNLTKLRNIFLKTTFNPGKLPMGKNLYVRKGHLQFLLDHFRKDEHELTPSILNPVDRQNVNSALRMCDNKVIKLLEEHLPRSEGTVAYLKIMRSVIDTFYEPNLTPLQRINKIWFSVFILRMWRSFIESQENLSVDENFLTRYTYACIEINAHSLVLLIIFLKNNDLDKWFKPFLYDSQP